MAYSMNYASLEKGKLKEPLLFPDSKPCIQDPKSSKPFEKVIDDAAEKISDKTFEIFRKQFSN